MKSQMNMRVISVWTVAQKGNRSDPEAFALCTVLVDASIDAVEEQIAPTCYFIVTNSMTVFWAIHGQSYCMSPIGLCLKPADCLASFRLIEFEIGWYE